MDPIATDDSPDPNPAKLTRTIAGHDLTLEPGVRFHATRPMACHKGELFTVTIRREGADPFGPVADAEAILPGLTYDEANAFLAAFNNGQSSWVGRVWGPADRDREGSSATGPGPDDHPDDERHQGSEEGFFDDDDFAAADRAWANIAARQAAGDDEDEEDDLDEDDLDDEEEGDDDHEPTRDPSH